MPDPLAENDQHREEAKDAARVAADYFNELLSKGLGREEALDLTKDYQAELFEASRPRTED